MDACLLLAFEFADQLAFLIEDGNRQLRLVVQLGLQRVGDERPIGRILGDEKLVAGVALVPVDAPRRSGSHVE